MLPGKVMQELFSNNRVIGGMTPRCSQVSAQLYETFVTGECVIASGPRVAELAKLTENSFRDVNIAFANELSLICDKLDMDVWELIRLANRHPRVNILQPGVGALHCRRPMVHRLLGPRPDPADPHRARGQSEQVRLGTGEGPRGIGIHLVANSQRTTDVTIAFDAFASKTDVDDLLENPAMVSVRARGRARGPLLVVEPNIASRPKRQSSQA